MGSCGYIHVYTSYCTVLVFNAVNGLDTFENVLNRIIHRVFTCFKCKTFVSHILQGDNFFFNFFLSEFFSCNMLVFEVIRTVQTAVYTVIRQIQRCKHNNSVAVIIFLNLLGKGINFLIFFFNVTVKQDKGFFMGKSLFQSCLFKNLVNKLCIMLIFLSVFKTGSYFLVIDEFLCMRGFRIVFHFKKLPFKNI